MLGLQYALPNILDWCAEHVRHTVIQGVIFHFMVQWLISGLQNALPNVFDWHAEYVRCVVVQGAILRCTTLQRLIGLYGSDLTCET